MSVGGDRVWRVQTKTRQPIPVEIWVLVAAAFLIALGFGIVAPVLPQFARSFDVGVMAASAIVSIFAFVRLVFAPAGGALISRFGELGTAEELDRWFPPAP